MQYQLEKIKNINILYKVTNDKEKIKEIIDLIDKDPEDTDIYEAIGALITCGKLEKIGLKSKCFDKYAKEEDEYLNFLECPVVDEGMFQCGKCKSKKIFTMSKQTRSGDEATTVFARCSQCKNGWILN